MKLNKSLLLLSVLIASCSGTEDITDILSEETEFLSFRLFKNAEELVEKVPPFKKDMYKYILTKFGL